MTLEQIKNEFKNLPENYKTKDIDRLNKRLIKQQEDVSCLKDICLEEQLYHRTYFQVEMGKLKTLEEQYKFIEDNFYLLTDWWHVDQLTQFLHEVDLNFAYSKAKEYVNHQHPFARRWGYVMFMPTLVKEKASVDMIISILKDDPEYYVVMAEAWLISYLAIYHPERALEYLSTTTLDYSIIGRAIQKTCDSFRVKDEVKEIAKSFRNRYKNRKLKL